MNQQFGELMKIIVTVKRVVDYNVKVHALADHSGPDTATSKMSMNPFDEIAVEQAVRFKEEGKADEVVVVSIGGAKTVDTLRVAMAMGADRAIHVATDEATGPATAAALLAEVVKRENPDLVLLGKQAIDDDAGQTGAMLSALLNWPLATCADEVTLEASRLCVRRETDDGLLEVACELPAVVTADLRLAEPRYVTLPNMMKAKKKPVQVIDAAELGVDMTPAVTLVEAVDPPARGAAQMISSVDELIDVLKNKAKVL